MRVAIIGTGAVANKHAQAYRNIGYQVAACANRDAQKGRDFAARYGAEFVAPNGAPINDWRDLCADPSIDFIDVCTLPDVRLPIVQACAQSSKPLIVEKPIAADVETARKMVDMALAAGIPLGVVSQHRFDDASRYLQRAISRGILGKILEADAYVKWYRSPAYYARAGKGTWKTEGGGALINQGIHSLDLLLWFAGPVESVRADWKLGALHAIESEDMVNVLLRFESGALGVIQASTALQPGSPERIEIHGTKGTATITGDKLTRFEVDANPAENDLGPVPLEKSTKSGASDPMVISLVAFERQFLDFGAAIQEHRAPLVSGDDGLRALELVDAIYRSCRDDTRKSNGAKA